MDFASIAPSLVIGVPSNASRAELGAAFALASRRLKTSASSPFTIEQLTTALADLEENLKTPSLRLWYRVPANPDVVQMDKTIAIRGVRFDVSNLPSDLELALAQDANSEDLACLTLAAAIRSLYSWKWENAGELARTCLRLSKEEELRDEALNVLAATLLARGEATKALDALRKAVEGEWNLTLQTNLAAVASETDPATAIDHMSYLIAGAADSEQRRQAALLAVALWKHSQGEEKGSDDEDDFDPLPRSVLDAIYGLLNSSDLTEENFYDLGMFLARVDGEKLSRVVNDNRTSNQVTDLGLQNNPMVAELGLQKIPRPDGAPGSGWLGESRYRNSPSARLIEARASGFFDYVAAFGPITRAREDNSRPWIRNAVEQYVRALSQMVTSSEDSERQKIAIMHGYKLFDTGMPTNTVQRVLLLVVLILNFDEILQENGAPKDVMDEWLTYAFQNIRDNKVEMEEDQKESLLDAIAAAAYTLVHFRHKEIIPTLREAYSQSTLIVQKTSGFFNSLTVDRTAVRAAARPVFDFCSESKKTYYRLLPMLRDEKARESVNTILGALGEIEGRLSAWL